MTADLHTHSDRTDGRGSAEAMADAAVEAGLTSWGLSDHVRADTAWLPDYVAATRLLRRDRLVIRCGVEAKILDQAGHLDLPAHLEALDYVLVADHQYPGEHGPRQPASVAADLAAGVLSAADVVTTLVSATAAAVGRAPFPAIVAHPFSLLPKMGLTEDLVDAEHLHALAAACLAAGAAVEINEKWRCPSARVLAWLRAAGAPLACRW